MKTQPDPMITKFNLVACDVGSHFALAHNLNGLQVHSWHFAGIRAHRQGALYLALTAAIIEIKQLGEIHAVAYETPFARGRDATRSLWGMAGIIEAVATNNGLPILDVANNTIKAFVMAQGAVKKKTKGVAPKDAMIKTARKRFGYTGKDEHEADAVCLLRYCEQNVEIPEGD